MMTKAHIEGLRDFAFSLLKARDISKLVKKQIVTKRGHKMTVYVKPGKKDDSPDRKKDELLDKETWEAEKKKSYQKLDAMRDALNSMKPGAEGREAIKQKATELSASMSRHGFFSTYDDYANNFQKRQWIRNRAASAAPEPAPTKPKKAKKPKKEKIYQLKPEDLKPVGEEKKGKKSKSREPGVFYKDKGNAGGTSFIDGDEKTIMSAIPWSANAALTPPMKDIPKAKLKYAISEGFEKRGIITDGAMMIFLSPEKVASIYKKNRDNAKKVANDEHKGIPLGNFSRIEYSDALAFDMPEKKIKKVIPSNLKNYKPAVIVGGSMRGPGPDANKTKNIVLAADGVEPVVVNPDYIGAFRKFFPNAEFHVIDGKSQIVVRDGGKTVGVLMPRTYPESDAKSYDKMIKRRMPEKRLAVAKADNSSPLNYMGIKI